MSRSPRATLVLCLAAVYVIWGSSYLATRIGVTHLPAFLFGGLRFLASGAILGAVAVAQGFRWRELRGQWGLVWSLGFAAIAFNNGLQIWAMQWLPSHTGALLNTTSAFWILLFGCFGRRAHRPSALAIAGLVTGFAGTTLLLWPGDAAAAGDLAEHSPLLPQLAILLGCVGWAAGTIIMRNSDTQLAVFPLTAAQMLAGGLILTAVGLARGEAAQFHPSREGLLAMGYLVLFSSCLAYTAYTWLAQNASPSLTGTYSYVNPAIAAVVGWLVLDETMSGRQMLGGAVIVAGVLLVYWPRRVT